MSVKCIAMNEKSFSVRRFVMSDVSGVVKLLELVFKRRFSPEWWNWKYKLNPAGFRGEKGDIWIAENANKEIVGHWAVIPEKIKFGSATITIAQTVDAATHPDYRRLGINKTLSKNVCSDIQNRYDFIFGFPKEVPYKYRLRQGWKTLRLAEFLKFLNYDRPLRSFFKNDFVVWSGKATLKAYEAGKKLFSCSFVKRSTGDSVEIQRINQFPDEIDDFWKQVRSEYAMCLERTATFLNWRFSMYFGDYQIFIARSVKNKNIAGYLVLKKTRILNIQNVLDAVDLQALPGEDKCVLNLIDTAITVAKNEGLDLIHCRVPTWHRYATILSKRGVICINHAFRLLKIYQPHAYFYQFKNESIIPKVQRWFYTLADTDYA